MITNEGFLECIVLYNALCTMHVGETMHCKPCYKYKFNPSRAITEIFWQILVNGMVANALAPCITRSSAGTALTIWDKHSYLPWGRVSTFCFIIVLRNGKNEDIFYAFKNKFSMAMVKIDAKVCSLALLPFTEELFHYAFTSFLYSCNPGCWDCHPQ